MPTGSAWGAGSPSAVASYAPLRPVTKSTLVAVDPGAMPGYIEFKFQEGLTADAGKARLGVPAAAKARQTVFDYGLPEPMPVVSGDVESIRARRLAAQDRIKANLPDLSLYFRVPVVDPALAATVIRELNALDKTETAFFEPRPSGRVEKPAGCLTEGVLPHVLVWQLIVIQSVTRGRVTPPATSATKTRTLSTRPVGLGRSTRLRLVSSFDDGYPDYFHRGTITVGAPLCDSTFDGDINGGGQFNVQGVVGVVNVAFRGDDPAPTDPDCPHATRADYNCDGQIDILDVSNAVNFIFRGGAGPCDPCAPS
ncbi:MAG: hypothetical protein HY304_01865 [candidate division Zixibacteria bacterium]|nr:hypothetical protein [candidate division Zixibacteria bacterium]